MHVKGTVVISSQVPAFESATVHVTLEHVSLADAGSDLVAEAIIHGVRHRAGIAGQRGPAAANTQVPFDVHLDDQAARIDPKSSYVVRVWVDVDGDGRSSQDDLYSDQSYPVLTGGFGNTVSIILTGPR